MVPERFADLPDYAFPRLRRLLDGCAPGGPLISMSIGEPRHPFPKWLGEELGQHLEGFGRYPPNDGSAELLAAIGGWITRRYGVEIDPETRIMALNGTREGLFNAVLALCPETKGGQVPNVLIPNPFYQAYGAGARAAGARPVYLPTTAETGFLPDFGALDPKTLDRTAIAFACSPSNPQGAVADRTYWRDLLTLAERHDFRVFADECYAELYRDTPPAGLLEVAAEVEADPERVLVFHSLSKRSNLPGLRSGFVAGGPRSMAEIKRLRSYGGAPLPGPLQAVAARVWADDAHVEANRRLYRAKYDIADRLLGHVPGYQSPAAGFFLWLPVADSEDAALRLWRDTGVRALPGRYLGHEVDGENPGDGYLRVALVAPEDETIRGLTALATSLYP